MAKGNSYTMTTLKVNRELTNCEMINLRAQGINAKNANLLFKISFLMPLGNFAST